MASDSWWRFYNTAPDHPKVLLLTDAQFRAWVTLNSLASKLGGTIPPDMALIGMTIRKTAGKASDIVQVLLSAKLLDPVEGGFQPHNWNEKQFKSDVSTERVKRFRNAKRNGIETPHSTETKAETERKKNKDALSRFPDFWAVCPKKVGKGLAEKAWPKACILAEPETLISGMKAYAAVCLGKDRAYVKTPGPWLNEKRWEDEGIAPDTVPSAETVDAASSAWDGRAAPLVAKIGVAQFQGWFKDATFAPGPPAKFIFPKLFQKNWVHSHFLDDLEKIYGEVQLEAA